ncbi:hypothetical protein D3C72_1811430 [compost metagenome]
MRHQPVCQNAAVLGKEVIDRRRAHLRHDLVGVRATCRLYRLQVVRHRGVHTGLNHGRHHLGLCEELLAKSAGLVVVVPVECRGELQSLRRLQAHAFQVAIENQQRRHHLLASPESELRSLANRILCIASRVGQCNHLRI